MKTLFSNDTRVKSHFSFTVTLILYLTVTVTSLVLADLITGLAHLPDGERQQPPPERRHRTHMG